jgi:membrane peptidoglycan carboxypeptidase
MLAAGIYGHNYYSKIISDSPLNKKVEQIQDDPDYVTIDKVSKDYLDAVIAVEDHRFYSHGAVDYIGVARAIVSNIRQKSLKEGGSTLTQQVAKNMYFEDFVAYGRKEQIKRKLAELFIAQELFDNYSRDEILELYINIIYFGDNYYGIREASKGYLGKEPADLTLSEATMLAGVPNAPSVYAPTANKDLCKDRQKKVVRSMVEYDFISQEEANTIDQSFIDDIN